MTSPVRSTLSEHRSDPPQRTGCQGLHPVARACAPRICPCVCETVAGSSSGLPLRRGAALGNRNPRRRISAALSVHVSFLGAPFSDRAPTMQRPSRNYLCGCRGCRECFAPLRPASHPLRRVLVADGKMLRMPSPPTLQTSVGDVRCRPHRRPENYFCGVVGALHPCGRRPPFPPCLRAFPPCGAQSPSRSCRTRRPPDGRVC